MHTNISVVMTVFNTKEEYLKTAIDSILNQTYKDFELIIINDGSTDETCEKVILSYSDERIKYHKQENKGISAARNLGTQLANGKYVAVMDSDDIAFPERLEKEYKFLENNPEYSLVGSWFEVFPRKSVGKMLETPKILDFFHKCWIMHSSVMFRKEDFEKNNLYYDENLNCAVDYDLWCRAAAKFLKFYNLQEVLVKYRVEGQGIATKRRDERIRNTIRIQQNILDSLSSDKKLQRELVKVLYSQEKVEKNFREQIFSVKNSIEFNKKYKVITILGIEIKILYKVYKNGDA